MPGLYDTAALLGVIYAPELMPELKGFWLQFFPTVFTSTSEKIMFDEIDQNEYRLAPFVAPNVQGKVMRSKGYDTKSFQPAYVKPKHVVDPSRAIPRLPGERWLGEMSLQQRWDAAVADNLRRERAMVENRWDWMAANAIINGSVTVIGDDYPTQTVDFKRDASLTYTLTGTAAWDQVATATPLTDLAGARRNAFSLSRSPITGLIFGLDAWAAFEQNDDVKKLLDRMNLGNRSDFAPSIAAASGAPFEYVGFIQGGPAGSRLDMWTYSNKFEDVDGTFYDYLDSGTVVGVGGGIRGVQAFGAVKDKRAGLAPLSMFPKMWDEEDPSVTYTMTQSAPLMVPIRPNNTFKMKVTS